jgi:hypothetical protein
MTEPKKVKRSLQGRKVPPGAGAFDSGHTDTADRADEALRELGYLKGHFKVGPGDTVEDVRRARELMGTEEEEGNPSG